MILFSNKLIEKRNYKIVHYDSKDARGVDVGLLYNPKYFTVEASDKLFVQLPGGSKDSYFTRDILWVKGKLDGETIHVYVNHWPSRVGGEERVPRQRCCSSRFVKIILILLPKLEPNAKIVIMGDLNDDPINASVAKVLGAKPKADDVKKAAYIIPGLNCTKKVRHISLPGCLGIV